MPKTGLDRDAARGYCSGTRAPAEGLFGCSSLSQFPPPPHQGICVLGFEDAHSPGSRTGQHACKICPPLTSAPITTLFCPVLSCPVRSNPIRSDPTSVYKLGKVWGDLYHPDKGLEAQGTEKQECWGELEMLE